jgi:hypothetical protein
VRRPVDYLKRFRVAVIHADDLDVVSMTREPEMTTQYEARKHLIVSPLVSEPRPLGELEAFTKEDVMLVCLHQVREHDHRGRRCFSREQ